MAILNNLRIEEYNKIQLIIDEVINGRKFKFDVDTIFSIIKEKALAVHIDNELLNCSYFYILILNTLDKFVDNGKIYKNGNEYIPTDFLICVDYFPLPSRLIYYINGDIQKKFIDINSLEEISYDEVKSSDFILCGGCSEEIHDEYKVIMQSEVSLEEVTNLYHDLICEGASESEAIIHLLNHYKVQSVTNNLNFFNEFVFPKHQIKKLSRKKIIHNHSG